jgi:hypothetical protein
MKIKNNLILLMLSILFYGCSENVTETQNQTSEETQSIIMFNNIDSIRLYKDPLSVNKISVNEEMLQMSLNYGGGCKEHNVTLYAFTIFLKSNPPQAEIFLSHNGNGDSCEAWINRDDAFNLEPLLELCRKQFQHGQILLRIYLPNGVEPIRPLPNVSF